MTQENQTGALAQPTSPQDKINMPGEKSLPPASTDAGGIFVLPRQKSRSRENRGSKMYLVDGQLCWATSDEHGGPGGSASPGSKRNSSVGLLFGSSMDLSALGQSMDSSVGAGSGSDEAISYRIKWCRENIVQLKRQTWPMEKKLQMLKASKLFIKQHQGDLKQSKQAKDVIANASAMLDRYWRHFKRECANLLVIITPWEMRIKKIESHFGSVVASYFTFLRWIFWLNLANSLVMVSFIMVPELIENSPDLTGLRKGELGMERQLDARGKPLKAPPEFNPTLGEMWEFEGFLKFSPIFYGYYSNIEKSRGGFWRNPLAFLLSAMLSYLFCFFCISRKLSQNTKLSRIGTKDDEYTFCWTVFVGWDFMIGNSETAYNKTSSLVMNLKEGILEEKEQTKDRDWRLIIRRVFANVLTLMLIVASAYVVTLAVQRSENLPEDASLLQKNELQLVMSGIQFMFPPLFDVIGVIEKYHPRKALSWQLGRILFLDFLNFYTLMFSLFGTVDQMGVQLGEVSGNITLLRKNTTYYQSLFTSTTTDSPTTSTLDTILNSTREISVGDFSSTTEGSFQNVSEETMRLKPEPTVSTISYNSNTFDTPTGDVMTNSRSSTVSSQSHEASLTNSSLVSSVLLASSTKMPSSSETIASSTVTMPTSDSTLTGSQLDTSSEGNLATTAVASTMPYVESTTDTIRLDTTSISSPDTTSQLVTKTSGDEDYPELEEVLKVVSRPRKKRALDEHLDDAYDELRVDSIERESQSTSGRHLEPLTQRLALATPVVSIPTIQDPYKKLGRINSEPVSIISMSSEELEEPLEGRLQVNEFKRKPLKASSSQPVNSRPTSKVQLEAIEKEKELYLDSNEDTKQTNLGTDPTTMNNQVTSTSPLTDIGGLEYNSQPKQPTTSSPTTDSPQLENTPTDGVLGKSALAATLAFNTKVELDVKKASGDTRTSDGCEVTTTVPFLSSTASYVNYSSLKSSVGFNASEVSYADCIDIPEFKPQEILALNDTLMDKLKTLCWETMFGQEMVKIVVMDLVMTVVSAVSFEFMRACFVRYCNRFFFWDLERGFPGYQDFKIAENVLHLVNNQSTVWMGMFFAPGLPAINTIKLAVLMYVRSWAVLTCNIPHETVFKVSKSNNFYYWILLINLLICILPVAYAVTWIRPSWHCGPFGGECRMYIVVTKLVKQMLPPEANLVFKYLTSPGAVIPILISLILIIYYLASTVSSSKEANKELKAQLKKDKEQEVAVPEITNTTVVDTPVSASAPLAPSATTMQQAALSSSGQTQLSTIAGGSASLQERLVGRANLQVPQQVSLGETSPKSLLAPPSV